jgi:hypothetical protein
MTQRPKIIRDLCVTVSRASILRSEAELRNEIVIESVASRTSATISPLPEALEGNECINLKMNKSHLRQGFGEHT